MNYDPLSVLVVDDENSIRQKLSTTLEKSPHWHVVGESETVSDSIKKIETLCPKVVFLDIKLRAGTAFDLLTTLQMNGQKIPPIVLNTGYREFEYARKALNEFQQYVIKLLEKPFWENWADTEEEIYHKVREYHNLPAAQKYYFIKKNDSTTVRVSVNDILYLKAQDSGTTIQTLAGRQFTYSSLKNVLKAIDDPNLILIHRSVAVNKNHIRGVGKKTLNITTGEELEVSRSKKQALKSVLADYPVL